MTVVFILLALRIRSLWKLPDGRDCLRGKLDLVLMVKAMLSKSLIQFSVEGWGCVPSLLFDLRPNYGGALEELMLKLILQYFGHLMRRADSFAKTLMLGKSEGRMRRGQ